MKILIHSSISLCNSSRAILYDEAEIYANEGHEVIFLFCDGLMNICLSNPTGNTADCIICKKNYLKEKKKLCKNIKFISLKQYSNDNNIVSCYPSFEYSTIDEIKNIRYKGTTIGLSSLSTYISITRNISPLIDCDFRDYFNQFLFSSIKLVDALENILETNRPERALIYNGRLSDSRPVWELVKSKGIEFIAFEAVIGEERMYKSVFYNTTSHMIDTRTEMINKFWNDDSVSLEEKEYYGQLFFNKRRNSQIAGDRFVYTKNQKKGRLPSTWNEGVRNIVIFISSEDEWAAVWEETSKYNVFESQLEGIRYIVDKFGGKKNFNFYIRIHPGLAHIKYKYHTDLFDFASAENVFVIDAKSPISSYTLLDNAEKVIVLGSTIGIEAVYWNKPTILIGPADYYYLDACYIPADIASIDKLIDDKLIPKDNQSALKYGYFLMNKHWPSYKYIDFSTEIFSLNFGFYRRDIIVDNWLKLLGSRRVYKIFNFIWTRCYKILFSNKKMNIPYKEL
jgi:hypothetical protein